jgi:hypothetical protein
VNVVAIFRAPLRVSRAAGGPGVRMLASRTMKQASCSSTDQGGGERREGIPAVGNPPCLIDLGINPSVHNKSKSTEPWPIFALHQSHGEGTLLARC